MRISRKSEYAIRALVAMARSSRPFQMHELSRLENIPVKFLEQIMLALRNAHFLNSKRGVGGGYTLRIAPSQLTIGEIIRAMDGPIAPVACVSRTPHEPCTCPDPRTCALRLLMTDVREKISSVVDHTTLEDMLRLSMDANTVAFEI